MAFKIKRNFFSYFLLFSFIFFIISEIVLRVQEPFLGIMQTRDISREVLEAFVMYEPHPRWDHTLAPNIRQWVSRGGSEQWFETNSQGFRHPNDIQNPKPKGVFRIFVMGDSFTEGAAPGQTVSNWISQKLQKDYPSVNFEVINAGVSSESLIPYTVRLRHQIFSFSPDLIIVNVDNSDVRDDMELVPVTSLDEQGIPVKISQSFEKHRKLKAWLHNPFLETLRQAGNHSYFMKLLWNIFFRIQIKIVERNQRWIEQPEEIRRALFDYIWIVKKDLTPIEQKLLKGWEVWIDALVTLCRREKVPVFLTTYPHPENFLPDSGQHVREILAQKSKELTVPYFDAYESLAVFKPEEIYLPEDVHYNAYGTQKWGEALGGFVSRELSKILGDSTEK